MDHGDPTEGRKIVEAIWKKSKPQPAGYTLQEILDQCASQPLNHYSERNIYGILYK